jgi:hypothetical protein
MSWMVGTGGLTHESWVSVFPTEAKAKARLIAEVNNHITLGFMINNINQRAGTLRFTMTGRGRIVYLGMREESMEYYDDKIVTVNQS